MNGPWRGEAMFSDSNEVGYEPPRGADDNQLRQAFLLTLINALRPLSDPTDVQRTTCELLALGLGVARVYYYSNDPDTHAARIPFDFAADGAPSLSGHFDGDDWPGAQAIMGRGRDFVVEDVRREPGLSLAERNRMLALGLGSIASVSVFKAGRLVGALCAADPRPRR